MKNGRVAPYESISFYFKNIFCIWQDTAVESAELWLDEIQSSIDNANEQTKEGVRCKYIHLYSFVLDTFPCFV